MSGRPIYVPSNKRRNKRFHGAFTGGFSAGYFNTVGSKEGWKPRELKQEENEGGIGKNATIVQQRKEDFMDEQDFNEWGGPTSVNRAFDEQISPESRNKTPSKEKSSAITSWARIEPPPNIGRRLLRVLGWRDASSTAYIPSDSNQNTGQKEDSSMEQSVLTRRRLKKIQLQQTRVRIPHPKMDTCGLGYDVFHEAPEFQAHRDKRRRQARERAQAVTGKTGNNVYRLSDLVGDGTPKKAAIDQHPHNDGPYTSHETMEDFVGRKTVGGFSLREDEDDVYDMMPLAKESDSLNINQDEYNTEIIDHNSDDEEHNSNIQGISTRKESKEVSGVLSSWLSKGSEPANQGRRGITSDGRPPLAGFVLGSASKAGETHRFPGPDLPIDFELKRHEFEPDEHPDVLEEKSAAEKQGQRFRQASTARQAAFNNQGPMAGGAFAGLADAIKNRFTKGASTDPMKPDRPAGLHVPLHPNNNGKQKEDTPTSVESVSPKKKKIKVVRSVMLFTPDALLCKRLNVSAPKHARRVGGAAASQASTREAAYFEKEIMKHVEGSQAPAKPASSTKSPARTMKDLLLQDDNVDMVKETDSRPSMEVYKSIFEPGSEHSDSESDNEDTTKATNKPQHEKIAAQDIEVIVDEEGDAKNDVDAAQQSGQLVVITADKGEDTPERRRRNGDRKQSRLRSQSPSDSTDLDASSSDEEELRKRKRKRKKEKKRKRRKEEKKKRRKSKSSRRDHES